MIRSRLATLKWVVSDTTHLSDLAEVLVANLASLAEFGAWNPTPLMETTAGTQLAGGGLGVFLAVNH
jgi:hypothetical protein